TDAHGDHHVLGTAALALDQGMTGEPGAGDAVRVADRNRAAVDVELLHRDAELVTAVHDLRRERLVQLPQVDVVHGQAGALQQPRDGVDRTDAHLVRLAAGHREAAEDAHRLDIPALGDLGVHHHARRGAVGKLAGIAGGDEPLGATHRLQLGQAFQSGVRAVALVAVDGDFLVADLAGVLVLHHHGGGERHDLLIELAGLLRGGGALLADQGVFVLRLAADVVALGDDVGGLDHRHVQLRLVLHQPFVAAAVHVELVVLHQADGLHAAGNHHRYLLHHDPVGGQGDGLQAGGAEAVDRQAGRGDRQAGADGRQTGHVLALRAFVEGGAEDDVLDLGRINAGTLHGVPDDESGHVDAVGVVERAAVGLAEPGARGGYDDCFRHGDAPLDGAAAQRLPKPLPSLTSRSSSA